MNPKTTIGLVIALIAALAGVWWAESSSQKPEDKTSTGRKALFDPPLADISEFEWVQSGSAPLKFVLQKDKWQMAAPMSGPTEHYVVNNDVTKLKDLKYSKAYPKSDPDRPTDELSGLQNAQRIAKLSDKNGKSVVLKIGSRQTLSSK